MNKQYRELDLHQALDAKIAGKKVEYECGGEWYKAAPELINLDARYRIAIEEPKQGDEILVWHDKEGAVIKRKYVCLWNDLVIVETTSGNDTYTWKHWKPIEQKREAREGWVPLGSITQTRNDIAGSAVYVREVLPSEDE